MQTEFLSSCVDSILNDNNFSLEGDSVVFPIKSFITKDDSNCFNIYDSKEHCIKCVFDKTFLKKYLSANPSYVQIDNLTGIAITITKGIFDIFCYMKDNFIERKVVLVIQEFSIDPHTKNDKESNFQNINSEPSIKEKIKQAYYNYLVNYVKKDNDITKLSHHQSITAENFIKEKYNPDRNYDSIIPVMENSKNFFFIRSKEEDLANLIKNESLYEIKDFCADDFKDLVEETKIIKSNEKKSTESDYKKLFFKQPSQINKENKDFSTYEKVDLKMLGQKTYRNIDANVNEISDEKADLAKMPQSIKDLIKKMESRPPIKANVFEKYKNARKSNSNI